jgi:putative exosortase-associated protein (TIGR04073 family)
MKRFIVLSLVILSILAMTKDAYCDDALKKLGRGLANCFTCPIEILEQVKRVNNSDGPMAAFSYGVLKGVGMTVVRAAVGVYETVTFPFPLPKEYKPILTDPEFFFEGTNW